MKKLYLILILCIIGYCFTQETGECSSNFENIIKQRCESINSCTFTDYQKNCIKIETDCSKGTDASSCSKIIPTNYHLKKCTYSTECTLVDKKCADYNKAGTIEINGDTCTSLKTGLGDGTRCDLSYSEEDCMPHFGDCTSLSNEQACNANIPSEPKKKCQWSPPGSTPGTCEKVDRYCKDHYYGITQAICSELNPSVTGLTCFYSDGKCQEAYDTCGKYNSAQCEGQTPLNSGKTAFDFTQKCYLNSDNACVSRARKCLEYYDDDATICPRLTAEDTNKKCVYNPEHGSNDPSCHEVYTSCQLYNDNEMQKTREVCEGINLTDENKKCIYIREIDKCMESEIYKTCDGYKGTDRYICESIESESSHAKCVLDKDLTCKERAFHCSEAFTEEDCHFYAKASADNKMCIFNSGVCYEVYKSCEDFTEIDETECENLVLYNGKKCVFQSNRCISKDKVCNEATTQDECKLIEKSGVSDPERKKCEYIGSQCKENYKYCSDYRKINGGTDCTQIKPYDETGTYIDITSKCAIDDYGLCQRISKDCPAANGNPIQCSLLSTKIKDNNKKFCAYIGSSCVKYYKNCEDIEITASTQNLCTGNKPKDYLNSQCEVEVKSGEYSCVTKKTCDSFNKDNYVNECYGIHSNCTYESSYCEGNEIHFCDDMVFFTEREDNETICNSLETTSPNKICTFSKGTSKCEEKFKDRDITSETPSQDNNSSEFLTKGIQFIMILLFLLL